MRYSFDEVNQTKSIVEVTIDNKKVSYQLVSLQPKQDLIKITGSFDEIMADSFAINNNDFIAVELTDSMLVPNAIDYLRTKFSNVLQITYPKLISNETSNNTKADPGFEKLDSVALFEQFYQKIKGTELSAEAKQIVTEIMMGGKKMLPNRLTMSAFGPYHQVVTIDFEPFIQDGLFLITGPTGAGKTMILMLLCLLCMEYQVGVNVVVNNFEVTKLIMILLLLLNLILFYIISII